MMRRATGSQRRPARRGQALTEFALVLPSFLALAFFIINVSLYGFVAVGLSFGTLSGARQGAIFGADVDGNTRICQAISGTLSSMGVNVGDLNSVTIFNAGGPGATPTDNSSAHDVGTCTAGTWSYGSPAVSTWPPGNRNQGVQPDMLGVTVHYQFHFPLPFADLNVPIDHTAIHMMEPR